MHIPLMQQMLKHKMLSSADEIKSRMVIELHSWIDIDSQPKFDLEGSVVSQKKVTH